MGTPMQTHGRVVSVGASVALLAAGFAAIFPALAAGAAEEKPLLTNGGFEQLMRIAGVPDAGGKHGSWVLKGGPQAPVGWALSSHFGGMLTVLSEGSPEGNVCLRMEAPAGRDAHIWQACAGIWAGGFYRVSIRYRGGPIAIKAYEYRPTRKYPYVETIVESPASAQVWQQLEGTYSPHGCTKVSIAASVAMGCTAEIDDFRVWQSEPEYAPDGPGWLNVQNHNASGSRFETAASTTAGSKEITVASPGDFKVGQGVMVSKCYVRYGRSAVRGPGEPYREHRPMEGLMELRGFDGSGGDWLVFLLDVDGENPLTFRWSDDLCRTWKGTKVPVTYDWQKLSGGLEAKFNRWEWKPGHFAHFSARTQLVSAIEKIEGRTLFLKHAANKTVDNAVVRHCDDQAIQACISRAIRERRNVYVPVGHYRLSKSLYVQNAAIRIEGASGVDTVMDITDGEGAVFALGGGKEVTLRNFNMVGHTPLSQKPATLHTATGYNFWCCAMKPCNAVSISATERVLVENVHARHMASECFYSGGPYRVGKKEPKAYTKSATFLRCSVKDCAANAFNNCDFAEGTSILYCRIDGAGWHAYEGSGRFIKFVGNYVCNAGPVTIGDIPHTLPRLEHAHELGVGQAVVANNVFEGIGRCGGIRVNHCPTQVVIANNLFINYNGNAIFTSGGTVLNTFPPRNIAVTGNIVDLTYSGKGSRHRVGIAVNTSDTTVSDNQVYVRGGCDRRASGIRIHEGAVNVNIHDNLVRNCATGLSAQRLRGWVTQVADAKTFSHRGIPLQWRDSHLYRGWNVVWFKGNSPVARSIIDCYDPDTLQLELREPGQMRVGDAFEVYPPLANWTIHSNTITDCPRPVVLDAYGSSTSVLKDNLISRGAAIGVTAAIEVRGTFTLIGNHIAGFDEKGSAALAIYPDPLGRACASAYRGNIFVRCANVATQSQEGLWVAAVKRGNLFMNCDAAPQPEGRASGQERIIVPVVSGPPARHEILARRLTTAARIDGDLSEWPWKDKSRVVALERSPMGDLISSPKGQACAAHDGSSLYLAMRFELPKGAKLEVAGGFDLGDGIEVSFRNADPKHPTPILLLWGSAGGTHESSTAMGASPEQAKALRDGTAYAAKKTPTGWACEWRIPFSAMGLRAADVKTLLFNMGLQCTADGSWVAWAPTGGRLCDVSLAGELILKR